MTIEYANYTINYCFTAMNKLTPTLSGYYTDDITEEFNL